MYLHCTTYTRISAVIAGSGVEFSDIWRAAVAAATNSAVNRLTAFGGRRPDEAWLAQQLQELTAGAAAALKAGKLEDTVAAVLLQRLLALVLAAEHLVQKKKAEAAADAAASCKPAGWRLVCSQCTLLQSAYNTEAVPPAVAQQLQFLTARVIRVLVQQDTSLPMPAALPGMLRAAANAAAACGDVSVYRTAVQHAQQLQLSSADLAAVRSAAVTGAAAAAAAQTMDRGSTDALRQLWPSVLPSASSEQTSTELLPKDAAAAVVAAVAVSTPVADLVLGSAALPSVLLVQLLQAAVDSKQTKAAQQLLAHAEQHQLLQQLPPTLLLAAVRQSSSTDATARIGYAQQAVELLLQQGQVPDAAAAVSLLPGTAAAEDQWQQLVAWLQQQCSTAPAPAAYRLLCDMLLASASKQTADQTWQLCRLLQSCQEADSWPAAQQGLPAVVTSALIQQQAAAAASSDSSRRVLHLWDTQQQAAAGQKLTTSALAAVMSALVASKQHAAALQLVAQQDAALMVPLAAMWRQQVPSTDVLVQALQQLCADSSRLGSAAAANVAEQLLTLLEQHQALQQAVQAQPATAVQLVQLLSEQSKLAGALRLVSCMLETALVDADAVAPAVAALVKAAAGAQHGDLQQQVVDLLLQQPADVEQQQAVLLAGLDQLLASKQAAAVGLLLHVLLSSTKEQQQLPLLLEPVQLEQLVVLCCSAASSSTSSSVFGLPRPLQLAEQCIESSSTSPAITVSLVNALAQKHPELQPAAAAVAFGQVSAEDVTAAGADSISSGSAAVSANAVQASQLIAQLCYMQLSQHGSTIADVEELSGAVSSWVDKLSHEAAAAALFSTWYWSQPTATAGSAGTAPAIQLPAASSIGVLGLSLYAAARDGKPSLSSLLLDLALTAAADARDWDRGALAGILQACNAFSRQASGRGVASCLVFGLSALYMVNMCAEGTC
jgi:hypothetical protein